MAGVLLALTTVAAAPAAVPSWPIRAEQLQPEPDQLGLFQPEPPTAAEVAAAKAKIKTLNGRLRTLQRTSGRPPTGPRPSTSRPPAPPATTRTSSRSARSWSTTRTRCWPRRGRRAPA